MTAEFDWWLLIVGLVIGAGLVWLILAELPRRDEEIDNAELAVESAWIRAQLQATNDLGEIDVVEAVLREHRTYLRLPPPDDAPLPPAPSERAAEGDPRHDAVSALPAASGPATTPATAPAPAPASTSAAAAAPTSATATAPTSATAPAPAASPEQS